MLAIPAFILAVCALCHCVALQTVGQRQRLEKAETQCNVTPVLHLILL